MQMSETKRKKLYLDSKSFKIIKTRIKEPETVRDFILQTDTLKAKLLALHQVAKEQYEDDSISVLEFENTLNCILGLFLRAEHTMSEVDKIAKVWNKTDNNKPNGGKGLCM